MKYSDKVIIMLEFKDTDIETLIADSFSLDSGILTVKKDNIKRTLRLDLIKSIFIL